MGRAWGIHRRPVEDYAAEIVASGLPGLRGLAGRGLRSQLDRDHPDLQIVGWYHSHPGHGIFLSSYDQFIHENFFSAPGMVALVVDPRDDDAFGWFGWNDGELTRLGSDLPVDRPDRAPIPREISDATDTEAAASSRVDTVRDGVLIAVAVLLVFFAGGWFRSRPVKADLDDARQQNRELGAIVAQQQSLAQQQEGDLHAVCEALAHAAPPPAADPETIEDADPTADPSPEEPDPAGQAAEDSDDPTALAHQICTAYAPPQPAGDAEATDAEPTPDGANSPTPSETP